MIGSMALAASLARSGSRKRALDALEQLLETGVSDLEQIRDDPDFEALRKHDRFRSLVGEP